MATADVIAPLGEWFSMPSPAVHLNTAADFGALTFELQDIHNDQLDSMSPPCWEITFAERDNLKQLQSGSATNRSTGLA